MSTRILVAGATGNIGQALTAELMRNPAGLEVIAASPKGQSVAGATARSLDCLKPASAAKALQGVDRLFLLTPPHPEMEAMTANAVAAAREAGVGHIVRIGGAGADADSEVAIARLQGRCDLLVTRSGIPYTLLQPKNFMQNFATFLRDMLRSGSVYSSQGEGRVPFVDTRDVAAAAAAVLRAPQEHAGQRYVLTGPEALTNAEALALIGKEIGREIALVPITEEQAVAAMLAGGMPESLAQAMSSLNRIIAAGWAAEVSPDLPRLLGRPATPVAVFAHDYRGEWI
ncbi:NAD(P)H dehydrogenase (quinone) [Burkholderiales bacterium]|nr:NAD(P)H dehydrogenase (quinone) [Burkholderiales bacterium]